MGELEEFDTWLFDRLRDLKTDENVFGPYIKSIVEGDEDEDEKIEGLDGLLGELQGSLNVQTFRDEILQRWTRAQSSVKKGLPNGRALFGQGDNAPDSVLQGSSSSSSSNNTTDREKQQQLQSECNGADPSESLVNKMENFFKLAQVEENSKASSSSSSSSSKSRGDIGADSALRAAILSQYCANESSSEEDEEGGHGKTSSKMTGVDKNVNAEKVQAEHRELKEKARAEHAKKKDRDKEDRAKQKQAQQDRKEKAKKKAQKGERRR